MYYSRWRPYVSVSKRKQEAKKNVAALLKKGEKVAPVEIQGQKIAKTFWGKAWCGHLEAFGNFENRLPRGRTYVRNGSVVHLHVGKGRVDALVQGSELYKVEVTIKTIAAEKWKQLLKKCSGQIGSVIDLLQGKLSEGVMAQITDAKNGLFPLRKEISYECNCPDWADMCKHVAAVLYGVGARLDTKPELLFTLRNADHLELIQKATAIIPSASTDDSLAGADLSAIFGIDIEDRKRSKKKIVRSSKSPAAGKKKSGKKK